MLGLGPAAAGRRLQDSRVAIGAATSAITWLAQLARWDGPTALRPPAFSNSAAPHDDGLASKLVVIPLPQLSPHMTGGSVRKWLKAPGDEVAMYDVVMEVDTDSLSEEAYKVGEFAGTVTMLVEAQEEGFLSEILVEEGAQVAVQTPVATMCESSDTLEALRASKAEVETLLRKPERLRQMTWQSYLKEAPEGQKGCS